MTIPDFLLLLLSFASLVYATTLVALLAGITRAGHTGSTTTPFVSIIVAAKNEEHHIKQLLDCLVRQTYSDYEVIIVDDRSFDRTAEIVKTFPASKHRVNLISINQTDPGMPPKKNALTQGIKAAKGEIVLFTDADCLPPDGWIKRMVGAFDEQVGIVAGYSPYDPAMLENSPPSLFARMLHAFIRYEELKAAIWSWGTIGIGKGWLCAGRNLGYRKKVWEEVGGFEEIKHSISGDDDLFLQLVRRTTSWEIRYASNPDSHVPTAPPESFGDFLEQRKRHFSAGRYFPRSMKAFFLSFHASNFILYLGLIAAFVIDSFSAGLWAFLGKSLLDVLLIWIGSTRLGTPAPVTAFFFMEIAYLVYNGVVGPLGLFGSFKWKTDTA